MLYILNHNCIVLQASHIDKYLYKLLTSPFLVRTHLCHEISGLLLFPY